ncbi:MAG TPA: acetylglutamate kinase [Candidatus Baltobacteraceae bacterium]
MLLLVKYGGNAMQGLEADPVLADLASLVGEGHRVVLVHGGGPAIDAALKERGIVEKRIAGLRMTGRASLDVVEYVLCATVNKALVRALCGLGLAAVGISGEDGPTLIARQSPPQGGESLGFVGEVEEVRPALIDALLEHRFVPVVAPLGVARDGSTAYNINGDTAAGALAGALRADAFVAVTDVPKILRHIEDPNSAIDVLTAGEAKEWRTVGSLAGGMIPKVDSALDALRHGAKRAIVAGAGPEAIRRALAGAGTELKL